MKVRNFWWLISVGGIFTTAMLALGTPAVAEWYTAFDVGAVIPHGLTNNEGTGSALGVPAEGTKFNDLSTSPDVAIGARGGYFFQSIEWLGLEADFLASWPKVKAQALNGTGPLLVSGTVTEGHMRVLVPALNVMARYPGNKFQPYVGVGPALAIIKTFDDGSTSAKVGFNAFVGIRFMLTNQFGLFTEYRYLRTSYESDHALTSTLGIKGDYSASHILVGCSRHF